MRLNWAAAGVIFLMGLGPIAYIAGHSHGWGEASEFTEEVMRGVAERQAMVREVVRAQKFELVDAQGVTRATLGPLEDGTSGLSLTDVDGNRVAVLAVDTDGGTGLVLTDRDLQNAVKAVVVRGKPGLKLRVQDEVIWEAP